MSQKGGFLPFAGTSLGDKFAPKALVSAFLNPPLGEAKRQIGN
jgi:hypothetical protein